MTMPIIVMIITLIATSPLIGWCFWQLTRLIREDRQLQQNYPPKP